MALYVGVLGWLTWPLVAQLATLLPATSIGCRADSLLVAWALAHESHALAGHWGTFFQAGAFHPTRDALLYGERAKAKNPDDWVVTGTPQSFEAYGCMMRRDDPQFKKAVDDALAAVMKSGEIEKIYKKWFLSPIPPKGLNLNFPLSPELAALFKNPNDKAFE